MQGLLAGDIDFTLAFPSVYATQENQLKPLAVVSDEEVIPGVPTTTELGYEDLATIGVMHRAVLAPAGVPEDRLQVLREAFAELSEDSTYQSLMERLGENTAHMGGAEYDELRQQQSERYQRFVEEVSQ